MVSHPRLMYRHPQPDVLWMLISLPTPLLFRRQLEKEGCHEGRTGRHADRERGLRTRGVGTVLKWVGAIGGPGKWTPSALADGSCAATEDALQSMLCSRWSCFLASRGREAPGRNKTRGPTVGENKTPLAVGHDNWHPCTGSLSASP